MPPATSTTAMGPILNQGQEGRLAIVIDESGKVTWQPNLTAPQ